MDICSSVTEQCKFVTALDAMKWINVTRWEGRKKMVFYLTMHTTHFYYGYMVLDFGSFMCMIPDRTAHTTACYTSRGVLAGTRNSSLGA